MATNLTASRALGGGIDSKQIRPQTALNLGSVLGGQTALAPNPERVKKTLQAAVQKGGPAAAQAQQLLSALESNPALANDPSFGKAVDQVDAASALGTAPGGTSIGKNAAKVSGATTQTFLTGQQDARDQSAEQDIISKITANAEKNQADNQGFVDNEVMPQFNRQKNAAGAASFLDQQALDKQTSATGNLQSTLNGLLEEQRGLASGYNAAASGQYGSYATGQNALNTQDQGTLSKYMGETDPLMQRMTARGSNAGDVSAQQAALSAAIGQANGSLDYQAAQSALAQAGFQGADYGTFTENGNDIARQDSTFRGLEGAGNGALDYQSQAARAYANQKDVDNQAQALTDIQNDVHGGDKDQREALDLIKSRTGVQATAEEALMAEQIRLKGEGDDRNAREAMMADMAQRGVRSGAAEIANMVSSRQQTAQNRTLSDLGALANAEQRARAYTGMQADQSNAMRSSQQQSLGLQGDLSSAIRDAGFDESYKRGVGADNASANNQGTKLAGRIGAATAADAMRKNSAQVGMFNTDAYNQNQMFNSDQTNTQMRFNAGEANAVGMFNAGQTNQASANNQSTRSQGIAQQGYQSNAIRSANDSQRQYEDSYAQNEAIRTGALAGSRASTALGTTAQIGQRNDTTYQKGADMLDTNYGRDTDTVSLGARNAPINYGADVDLAAALRQSGADNYTRQAGLTGTATGIASQRAGTSSTDSQRLQEALALQLGTDAKNKALSGRY